MAKVNGVKVEQGSIYAVLKELNITEQALKEALLLISKTASIKMADWAKDNAKWVDRTSNARQGIIGDAYWENQDALLTVVYHQVDYGIWLELAMERKYAILEEAISQFSSELVSQYRKLVG